MALNMPFIAFHKPSSMEVIKAKNHCIKASIDLPYTDGKAVKPTSAYVFLLFALS